MLLPVPGEGLVVCDVGRQLHPIEFLEVLWTFLLGGYLVHLPFRGQSGGAVGLLLHRPSVGMTVEGQVVSERLGLANGVTHKKHVLLLRLYHLYFLTSQTIYEIIPVGF